jgi:hypothetical protein
VSYHDVIRDCAEHGTFSAHYSVATLRDARAHLPAAVGEYSNCASVIDRAILQAARPGGGTTAVTSTGAVVPTGGSPVPSPATDLPGALLLALIVLAAAAVLLASSVALRLRRH